MLFSHSVVPYSATSRTAAHQASLSFAISQSLLKLMSIELVKPSSHLIFCRPLLLPPSIFLSIRAFSNESALRIRWPKIWELQFQHQSFQSVFMADFLWIDWFDLFAIKGTLKGLLQHYSFKASILWHSAIFYGPTLTSVHNYWKTIA